VKCLPEKTQIVHSGQYGPGTAEFVVMSMLMLPRKVYVHDYKLRRGRWDAGPRLWGYPPEYETLVDKTVLIVGTGFAGPEIGKRLEGFGVHRIGVSEELPEYLPVVDYVVAASLFTPGARPTFAKREFDLMKPTAYFINVGEARIAEEMALFYALKENSIAGAALDSWYRLPKRRDEICFPSDYPFHTLTNVIMSPCRAGWTKELLEKRADEVADAIKRLYTKEPVANY
jgi:phosphoglycerate dehydrogenase-like enzyme